MEVKSQDGDSTRNVQGPQSKFLLGSWARFSWGTEGNGLEEQRNGAGTSPRPWAAWPGRKVQKSQACDPHGASEKTTDPLSMWEANGGVLTAPWQRQPLAQRQAGTIVNITLSDV